MGPRPVRTELTVRPVVAVLDTGCGNHPWLTGDPNVAGSHGVVTRDGQDPDGGVAERIGLPTQPDPEDTGDLTGPLDGIIDAVSGHGTFICGLVHQICPDADLLSIRVIHSDGIAVESDLIGALEGVLELVERHAQGEGGRRVDVVSLSLGYYHEQAADAAFDLVMLPVLQRLADHGVVVVAAAGNDATRRPMLPAAFTPHPGGLVSEAEHDRPPVIGVGGLNPDGSVALFSNGGPWVRHWEPGAALVSTIPPTFRGAANPAVASTDPSGALRQSLDPDDFRAGFAVWSGTSFAAPLLAGRLAQALIVADGQIEGASASAVDRAWHAVEQTTQFQRP